jgi:hypothetical protein
MQILAFRAAFIVGVIGAIAPDVDVFAFRFGIRYADL